VESLESTCWINRQEATSAALVVTRTLPMEYVASVSAL